MMSGCFADFQCVGDQFLPHLEPYQRKFFAGGVVSLLLSLFYYFLVRYSKLPILFRQLYLILTGTYILWSLLHFNSVHIFLLAFMIYVEICYVPVDKLPLVFLTSTYAYLSFRLLHFMFVVEAKNLFHDSGLLMFLVAKCTYVVFGVYDSDKLKNAKQHSAEETTTYWSITELQTKHLLTHKPSLLQFASFVCFSPNVYFGPCMPYKTVKTYIEMPHDEIKQRPSFFSFLFQRLSLMVFFVAVFVRLSSYAEFDWLAEYDASIPYKWFCSIFIGELLKMKYYVLILLGECCATACGIGFSGCFDPKTKQPLYSNVLNMKIFNCMLPTSPKILMEGWHITVSQWLRYLVYERSPLMPTVAVFLASALWHGFYASIYVGLSYGAILVIAGRNMRRLLHHHIEDKPTHVKFCYDILTTLFSVMFSHPFMLIYVSNESQKFLPLLTSFLWLPAVICLTVALIPVQKRPPAKTNKQTNIT